MKSTILDVITYVLVFVAIQLLVGFGFDLRMGIIRVQDRQMVLGRAGHRQHGYHTIKENTSHSIFLHVTLYTLH